MESECEVGPQGLLKLRVQSWSTEVRRKLDSSSHLGHHLDRRNQTLISKFSLLLKQLLIFLVVRAVLCVWQLPSNEILVTLVPVGPAIPFVSTLVHNDDDFVQKLRDLGFQCVSDVNEAVDPYNKEDRVDSVTRDHNF